MSNSSLLDISSYQKEAPEITVGVLSPDTMMDVWKARFPNEDVSNFTADEFYTYLANHEAIKIQVEKLSSRAALVRQIMLPALFAVICMLGLCGNGLVIFCTVFLTQYRTCTDVYVTNLAIADFIFVATMPFWAFDLIESEWKFGLYACKILSFTTYLNMSSSILLLTAMAIDRYLAVVNAINSRPYRTVRNSLLMSVLVWVVSIVFSMQAYVFRTERELPNEISNKTIRHCSWDFPGEENSTEYFFWINVQFTSRVGFAFVIPLLVITYCYMSIFIFLRKRRQSNWAPETSAPSMRNERSHERKKKQDKSTRLVASVILVFFICWLPNHVSNLLHWLYQNKIMSTGTNSADTDPERIENTIHMLTAVLGFSNSCVNPLLYAFLNNSFRSRLKALLSRRRQQKKNCFLPTRMYGHNVRESDFPPSDTTNLTTASNTPRLNGSVMFRADQNSFISPRTTHTDVTSTSARLTDRGNVETNTEEKIR